MIEPSQAAAYARGLLHGDRLRHVTATGLRAEALASHLPLSGRDRLMLVSAGWLHDIGYGCPHTGWHPIDGARWARQRGEKRLAGLIGWHTTAGEESDLLGLRLALVEVAPEREDTLLMCALTWLDMTTGPRGQRMSPGERLSEVEVRHGSESSRSRAMHRAWPRLNEMFARLNRVLTG